MESDDHCGKGSLLQYENTEEGDPNQDSKSKRLVAKTKQNKTKIHEE